MNFGKALSFLSPAAGIASGNGMGALPFLSPALGLATGAFRHHGGGAGVPDPSQAGAAVPTPQPPAVPAPQPVAPPGPAAAPMQPPPAGGLHGIAFHGGRPDLNGILAGLQMMAPGQRRF